MQFLQCSFVECSFVYLFFSLRAVCSPLGRIYNIATNVSFVSCSFLRCFRCSFPCVFSLVYIVIVFVRCFICSFNRTVSFRSALKIALELVSISRQWQLQSYTLIRSGLSIPRTGFGSPYEGKEIVQICLRKDRECFETVL